MLCVRTRHLVFFLVLAFALMAHAAPSPLHWERIRVVRASPSQIFARLGIGHNTRRGYTRDGAKKTDPDPTFPLGLTDVVPLDSEHLLLARGTPAGLAAFKMQVALAETQVTAVRWQVTAQLVQAQGNAAVPIGPEAMLDAPDNTPFILMLGMQSDRPYQVRVSPKAGGMLKIVWQRGLVLTSSVSAPHVLAPDIAWSTGVSRTVLQGGSVTFDDLATDRIAARLALGLPPDTISGDYGVRLTVTPLVPPDSPLPVPASPQ